MELSIIGVIVIILSLYGFFKNEDFLLDLVFFFSIFVAASAINVIKLKAAFTPFEIPMILWVIKQMIHIIRSKKKLNSKNIIYFLKDNKMFTALVVFIIAIILSECFLLISKIDYKYFDTTYNEYRYIKFGLSNIKSVRIIFFIIFTILLATKVKKKEQIKHIIKVFLISTSFAVLWGVVQYVLFYLDIEYPAFLFNNNPWYAQGYGQILYGIKRICSIGTEPSSFALNIITAIPLILIPIIFNKKNNNIIIGVLVVLLMSMSIMTTSTTAIACFLFEIGLIGLYLLYALIKKKSGLNYKKALLRLLLLFIASCLLGGSLCFIGNRISINKMVDNYHNESKDNNEEKKDNNEEKKDNTEEKQKEQQEEEEEIIENNDVKNVIDDIIISKMNTDSGQERINREKLGLKLYLISPVFGIGFGSFRTYSLFTNALVNMGIIGLVSLLYVFFVAIIKIFKNRKKDEIFYLSSIIFILGSGLAYLVSIPDFIYVYTWSILVLSYNYFDVENNNKRYKKNH